VRRRSLKPAAPNQRDRIASDERSSHNVLKVGADFYVLASALTSRRRSRVLADGQSFAVFDVGGDILDSPLEALGFFYRDTRYLSRFELRIHGSAPYFLNSYLSDDKSQLRINLTNPDLNQHSHAIRLPRDLIQIERSWVLTDATLVHRLRLRNYAGIPLQIPLEIFLDADFADIFEVRGVERKRHGRGLRPETGEATLRFPYEGLDGVRRFTEVTFDSKPRTLKGGRATFLANLDRDETASLEISITGGSQREMRRGRCAHVTSFDNAFATRRAQIEELHTGWAKLSTSNELFDSLLTRSQEDLASLISHTADGTFMMAGIPWFATLFGRDSIITTLGMLPFNPQVATLTLRTLAGMQGERIDETRGEQPGKIVHEIRGGEMAATGEVPFGRFYGSVDSTPLFLWLYGRCVATIGNLELAEEFWPSAERALEWIERWGDRDGDGYVEYPRETPRGLANQGWKDSFDSISHSNGELARAPIALAEVQGYVYAAYLSVADVARRLGRDGVACRLAEQAAALKRAFSRDFWLEPERTVALALDAEKQPCRVMASNGAHCLATGLLEPDQASALSERLFGDDMFSGWGVRTLGTHERRYNPMSYHNGSVWPHDNAIAAMGLARYENRRGALQILEGLFDSAVHLETASLPELFCGFPREPRLGPVPYPVACHPQAWSAASVFMVLQAVLGIEVFGFERRVLIDSPTIPAWLEWLRIEDLKVGEDSCVSLIVRRTDTGATAEVLEKGGPVTVEIRK
jgi:glycogen debranching enzyme